MKEERESLHSAIDELMQIGMQRSDIFSKLGSVKKDGDLNMVMEILNKKPQTFQVEKPELSQKTKGEKMVNKKTKQEQVSDPVSKLKLLTEKPEASWWKKKRRNGQEEEASIKELLVKL
ncbi:unnamed protein product [Eruca vesicaria subsp. sativa]|uniref:Uncharacterized protein n=1 Tax=Eruca vesicaria subsp. sativa TaxID=29727 RepID=A0ABC8KPM3_ERUVS|nr:unnamed protein product [Eruca vesicaria subsp. sativa]